MTVQVLIVGDLEIHSYVFQKCLKDVLADRYNDLEIKSIEMPGTVVFDEVDGVREALGSPQQLIDVIKDTEILIVDLAPVTAEVIRAGSNLKLICCSRGGPVNVDVQEATTMRIPCVRTKGRNANVVADFTFGLLLAEALNIARGVAMLKSGRGDVPYVDGKWHTPVELPGKTIGIIGYGDVGRRVANRARGFEMRVLVYDPYVSADEVRKMGVEMADLRILLSQADFVTIHARATPENFHLIGSTELHLMKKTAYLINTSRGQLVDEQALHEVLTQNSIAGAALDVFEREPIDSRNPLLGLENVTLTPHIAGGSDMVPINSALMVAENVRRFLVGERLLHVVNPAVLQS
jgi:D-3-phosphoglycerate dehydrogenase